MQKVIHSLVDSQHIFGVFLNKVPVKILKNIILSTASSKEFILFLWIGETVCQIKMNFLEYRNHFSFGFTSNK